MVEEREVLEEVEREGEVLEEVGEEERGRRRERTPSLVQAEEEKEDKEEAEQEEEEDDDEEGGEEEGAAGEPRVWLRGPSTLPPRPIPLERRPIIRPRKSSVSNFRCYQFFFI